MEGRQEKGRRKTILVVDDHTMVRDGIRAVLEPEDYDVIEASNGEEAVTKCARDKPDLVLMDIVMPVMSGLTAVKAIRQKDITTPIVMLTQYDDSENAIVALRSGADAFIPKREAKEELVNTVKKLLRQNEVLLVANRCKELTNALEEENQRLRQEIRQLQRSGGVTPTPLDIDAYKAICAAAAHGLKTEFLHIGSSSQNLQELAGNSSDVREEVETIRRSLDYSQLMLRRLLDHLDVGKRVAESLVDISKVLRKTEELFRPRLPSSVQLEIMIDDSVKEQRVSANDEQLMEILIEILTNASNALRRKGGAIKLQAVVNDSEVAISVKDDGPGIPEELVKKLFNEQLPSETGLGLGLFLCKRVITALRGKIEVETSSEGGTTVTILLPKTNEE